MLDVSPFLLLAIGIVAVIAALVVGYLLEQKRRERLMAFCLGRGWSYVGADPLLAERFTGEPFGKGDDRQASNVVTGHESGREFTAFDYSYDTHSTDSKGRRRTTTHRFAITVVPLPVPLGRVDVLPEDLFTRAAAAVGLTNDIELESEAFNRAFRVAATNPKHASDILTPRTMAYLIAAKPSAWRIDGSAMVAWARGRLDPAAVVKAVAILDRVQDGIPGFVWKDAGAPGSGYSPGP